MSELLGQIPSGMQWYLVLIILMTANMALAVKIPTFLIVDPEQIHLVTDLMILENDEVATMEETVKISAPAVVLELARVIANVPNKDSNLYIECVGERRGPEITSLQSCNQLTFSQFLDRIKIVGK